jgi:UDPglucose 6-dehydrogenase
MAAGRLSFVVGARAALAELAREGDPVEVMFLCVPTPMGVGGVADLSAVESVLEETREALPTGAVVVNKSTVPVGTAERTAELLDRDDIGVVSNPEFLREGTAVHDFLNPDRVVVGSGQQDAAERVAALYARLGAPTVLTDAASAEMIKYSANCFLAMKLSYVNAIAELCERLDADIADVTEGIGYDRRIGQSFLAPGPAGAARACRRTPARCCRWPTRPTSSSGCCGPPSTPTPASCSGWSTRSARWSPASAPGR